MPPERSARAELATLHAVLAQRLAAQLLAGAPAADPAAVCERLLAVQGQDPRGARLAVRARSSGLTAADVDAALDDHTLLITWLNRGTLHLVRSEDYPWLQALTTPQLRTGSDRRLAQEGVSPAAARKGAGVILKAIAADGPQSREELRDRLVRAGVPTAGQALIHVLFRAALDGLIVRGPMRGKQQLYVLVEDWLPRPRRFDRDTALAELGRRYLAGHAPADDRDLAKWAGITLGDARRALSGARPPRRRTSEVPKAKLLGAFDELLMGWADRSWVLPRRLAGDVITGGIFRPSVLLDGQVAGTWTLDDPRPRLRALQAERADVERFLAG